MNLGNVSLPAQTLARHAILLGQSGSGKTVLSKVLVEELIRSGIRVVCIDCQGDLGGLAIAGECGDPGITLGYFDNPYPELTRVPPDIDSLQPGQLAILNTTLADSDAKQENLVGETADRIYRWMLRNASEALQLVFIIDEAAMFLPATRKPSCKEPILRLLKQGRKFGIGVMVATQNPGDLDYKGMGQAGTWFLGRLTTPQDLDRVGILDRYRDLAGELPTLTTGEFIVVSPDNLPEPGRLKGRRLVSLHKTLSPDEFDALARLA